MKALIVALLGSAALATPAMAWDCGSKKNANVVTDVQLTKYGETSEKKSYSKNIVETAQAAGSFETLITAAVAADLGETLAEGGPFTVFAPTDTAFAALPEGTLDTLLMEENKDQLAGILTFHVVPGEFKAEDLAGKVTTVETVNGQSVTIDGTDGVTVNDTNVISADVKASNGIIHVIDGVLLPQ
jgi:uncharacterized surface protein with fasciclin (FAS1) repeats